MSSRVSLRAADVYSLGVILYHLLRAIRHLPATRRWKCCAAPPGTGDASAPNECRTSRDLETICLKCLEKEPAARIPPPLPLPTILNDFAPATRSKLVPSASRTAPGAGRAVILLSPDLSEFHSRLSLCCLSLSLATTFLVRKRVLRCCRSKQHCRKVVNWLLAFKISPAREFVERSRTQSDRARRRSQQRSRRARRSARKALEHVGEIVRLHVELNDGNGQQIWAETLERHVNDALAMQRDLALRITAEVKAKLGPNESSTAQPPTKNKEAYLLYLQANDLYKVSGKKARGSRSGGAALRARVIAALHIRRPRPPWSRSGGRAD